MKFTVQATQEELAEMGMDQIELADHIIFTLDSSEKDLSGYNVEVEIVEKKVI